MNKELLKKYFSGEYCTPEELSLIAEFMDNGGESDAFFFEQWKAAEGEVTTHERESIWANIEGRTKNHKTAQHQPSIYHQGSTGYHQEGTRDAAHDLKVANGLNAPHDLKVTQVPGAKPDLNAMQNLNATQTLDAMQALDATMEPEATQDLSASMQQYPGQVSRKVRDLRKWWTSAAAAVILLVLGSVYWIKRQAHPEIAWNKIENTSKDIKYIKLSDGTEIWLNVHSSLSYADNRQVRLTGEAFFEVAKDEHHPFIVYSNQLKTTVLGTSFNIRAWPAQSKVQVALVSGKVQIDMGKVQSGMNNVQQEMSNVQPGLSNIQPGLGNVQSGLSNVQPDMGKGQPGMSKVRRDLSNVQPGFGSAENAKDADSKGNRHETNSAGAPNEAGITANIGTASMVLLPGQVMNYDSITGQYVILEKAVRGDMTGWVKGKIVLDNTPLPEILQQLEQIYSVTILYDPVKLASVKLTGQFRRDRIEDVLKNVLFPMDLTYSYDNGKYLVHKIK